MFILLVLTVRLAEKLQITLITLHLASFFSTEVTARHDTDFPFRNRGIKEAKFAVLSGTVCPAVLTENLFMDTKDDFMFLCSEKGRTIIADIHVRAILKYLGR